MVNSRTHHIAQRPAGSARSGIYASTVLAVALAICGQLVMAAGTDGRDPAAVAATYRSERQACMEGGSGQGRETCLKEAAAVRQQALTRGLDSSATAEQLQRNAAARCGATSAADREDCRRLARGEGQRSGSVAGGGVLMEITTRQVVPPTAASAASAAATATPTR